MRELSLLNTKQTPKEYHKTKLTIGINGQSALQVKQLLTIERTYKNWNKWQVKLGSWLINRTSL